MSRSASASASACAGAAAGRTGSRPPTGTASGPSSTSAAARRLASCSTREETDRLAGLYDDDRRFRSTIDMARHRYGEGSYRYFAHPLPDAVSGLRRALYPRLLPVARDWWVKLGREPPWPDDFDEWLDRCHRAGQDRPTPLLLRYEAGGWNALHRDLYGELVFPLQVVVNLTRPGRDHTGGEFVLVEQRARGPVAGHRRDRPPRSRARVHDPGPAGALGAGLVDRRRPPRGVPRSVRPSGHARPHLPRCQLTAI